MAEDLHGALGRVAETFDFGDYEVRAYLTVLEGGEMTAAEIAEEATSPSRGSTTRCGTSRRRGFSNSGSPAR